MKYLSLASGFTFQSASTSKTLQHAFLRYSDLLFGVHGDPTSDGAVSQLTVKLGSEDETLQQDTDESYTLDIGTDGSASISAPNVYGAMHGLETFSQLIFFNFSSKQYELPDVHIEDAPRFGFRGVLIDTSRHYEPLRGLRQLVDSLAFAKMNVLHWHAVDAQSFPLEVPSYPKLSDGAYNPAAKYTKEEMAEFVEYARQRGVRVMIEFDGPGHSYSWGVGYPQLLPTGWNVSKTCANQCPPVADNPCNVPLDPSNNFTYQVLEGLYRDMTGGSQGQGIFFEDLMHLGGDEVDSNCWALSPEIAAFMKAMNYTTYDQVYMYFVQHAHQLAISMGRSPVCWEEVFNHFGTQLDKRTVVHIWLSAATLAKVVAAGYRTIFSNNGDWYLDHLDTTWQHMYSVDPTAGVTNTTQLELIIGGEACMWGETVDISDMLQTVWPRAAAVAERLWSPAASTTDPSQAESRFAWFRCLMNDRGIAAAPHSLGGRAAPPGPGDCYQQ